MMYFDDSNKCTTREMKGKTAPRMLTALCDINQNNEYSFPEYKEKVFA